MARVSVVIPTYNGSRYLPRTIESVLGQTFKDFEIIVVDDGSEEDLEALLRPFREKVSYVRIWNSGPASARNVGLKESSGEFVALLDHDDVWAPGNLQQKLEMLQRHPEAAVVYSYPELIDAEGNPLPQEYPPHFPSGSVFEHFLQRNWIVTFSATLVRKEIFSTVGFLDERQEILCCDDYDIWLRIADASQILFSPDKNVFYRIHPTNLIAKDYETALNSHLLVLTKALNESAFSLKLSEKERDRIIKEHNYTKRLSYAYKYYYNHNNYVETLKLLRYCVARKPYVLKNWLYLSLCLLPGWLIDRLRSAKSYILGS